MIPKIIHYTWFSHDEMPEKIKRCMASWKRVLPDYEIKHWGMEEIQNIDSDFLREALDAHMWAYAADFVRLWAVYHEGGIYLDTDVEVYKSFDGLLGEHCFIGKESSINFCNEGAYQGLSSHCFGAEKGNEFIGRCLSYFKDRHFVTSKDEWLPKPLRMNIVLLPYIQAAIGRKMGYNWNPSNRSLQRPHESFMVLPSKYLDPWQGRLTNRKDAYILHLAAGGWRDNDGKHRGPSLPERVFIHFVGKILGRMHYVVMKYL